MNLDHVNKQLRRLHQSKKLKYVITYPAIEIETKINPRLVNLTGIIYNLKNFRIDEIIQRKEFHHYHEQGKASRNFIFVQGSDEVWIKEKTFRKLHYTPFKVPILLRQEKKIRPGDSNYHKLFLDTLNWQHVGSFYKECVDISFWFENLLFTVTFMNAILGKSILSQIELEFDGHSSNIKRPSIKKITAAFDTVSQSLIRQVNNKYFTSLTKLEWLKGLK